eukprot:NODE_234_length_12000_cov_0.516343.p11 type:complete len:125 gc:universal NODE_234_length_12000_cov_0.516343:5401-5775(+)
MPLLPLEFDSSFKILLQKLLHKIIARDKMALSSILHLSRRTCIDCHQKFPRNFEFCRHRASAHGRSIVCSLCKVHLKGAVRKDTRILHLLRCDPFIELCIESGITEDEHIKVSAHVHGNRIFLM